MGINSLLPADIAIRTGCPLVVGGIHRAAAPLRFAVHAHPPLRPDLSADPREERLRLLTRMNELLCATIRQAPEQWLWMHRRWKTQPKA